jgi:hypothetical protein
MEGSLWLEAASMSEVLINGMTEAEFHVAHLEEGLRRCLTCRHHGFDPDCYDSDCSLKDCHMLCGTHVYAALHSLPADIALAKWLRPSP